MKRSSSKSTEFPIKPYIPKRLRKKSAEHSIPDVETVLCTAGSSTMAPSSTRSVSNVHNYLPLKGIVKNVEHSNVVSTVQWSPTEESTLVSASFDNSLIIWNYSSRKLNVRKKILVHDGAVMDVKWNYDGTLLLSASFDQTAKLVNVETGITITSFKHKDLVTRVIYHKDEQNVFLTGTMKTGIVAWDIRQSEPVRNYKSLFGKVQDLLFLPDGKTFLSSAEVIRKNSMDKSIMAWDFVSTAVVSNQIYQEPYTCTKVKLHPNQRHFYAQSSAGYIVIFNVSSPWKMNKFKRYEGHQSSGYHVGFDVSPDGGLVYSGDANGLLCVYNNISSKLIKKQVFFSSTPCIDVACHPAHASKIACCSWDGAVACWE